MLPDGDVLVAETNAPERPLRKELLGVKGWVMGKVMKRAGAAVPSANRITLLRDADGDGSRGTPFRPVDGLNSPFGMALVGDELYVANTDALVRFPYRREPPRSRARGTQGRGPARRRAESPLDEERHRKPDGSKLYVTVGSNSNVAENGMEKEVDRAAILEIDAATGARRVYRIRPAQPERAGMGARDRRRCGR